MSPKNTKHLFDQYPRLYRGRFESIQINLMRFGFECADGWFDILDRLSKKLEEIARKEDRNEDKWPITIQVKEKFGTLRYSFGYASEDMNQAKLAACKETWNTCEDCGQDGKKCYKGMWERTQCKSCAEKNDYFWSDEEADEEEAPMVKTDITSCS